MPSVSQIAKLIQNVYKQTKTPVAGYEVKAHTDSAYFYQNASGDTIFAIRGMKFESPDLKAVSLIISNSLKQSARYKRDLAFVSRYLPSDKSKLLFVGHSLGGAICDQMLYDGIATRAITINPAVMPRDLRNTGNERYYNPNDFLYLLIGRYASHIHVIGTKFDFTMATANAQLPSVYSFWTHHAISKFVKDYTIRLPFQKGESSHEESTRAPSGKDYVVQSVVLHKEKFPTREDAIHWVARHGYKHTSVDETLHEYRFRQMDPDIFKMKYSPHSIKLGEDGFLVVGYED
jgi:hypothetical protein